MPKEPDVLYTGTGRHVVALHRETGAELWRTKLPSGTSTVVSLLLKGRQLFVGHSGRVYCLDADSGRVLWENGLPRTGFNPVIMAMAGLGGSAAVVVAAHVVAAAAQAATSASAAC
ncbi:MAG: PQQ-binding-like beta-propeller repeat protein [Planctomycetes bacterium]|nr:PQQ-binding-like beta-propeller repeat protein [Planctomycetota bacterium]